MESSYHFPQVNTVCVGAGGGEKGGGGELFFALEDSDNFSTWDPEEFICPCILNTRTTSKITLRFIL